MAATKASVSTSARVGYALATSALLAAFNAAVALFVVNDSPTFDLYHCGLFVVSLILFAAGVALVVRDPLARKLGWRLLFDNARFGDRLHRFGYGLTIGGLIALGALLIIDPIRPWYSENIFRIEIPFLALGASLYIIGWLLVVRSGRKKAAF